MKTRTYIENCFCLTPKHIDDCLSRIGRKIGDNRDTKRADIHYDYDKIGEQYYKVVTIDGFEPQKILTEVIETSFGDRQYFHCNSCNARCHKLFLLPDGHIFACFKCQKLKRQIFNTSSKHGKLYDMTKKVIKLINEQETMTSRIWYRDAYTKRYSKFLNECLKVGLTDLVDNARAVESAISANN